MVRVIRGLIVWACLLVLPATTYAQASISGIVRDTSGAVLPGVTVEAASPVLIEKARTAVTDGTGRYRIVDLRPGTYSSSSRYGLQHSEARWHRTRRRPSP